MSDNHDPLVSDGVGRFSMLRQDSLDNFSSPGSNEHTFGFRKSRSKKIVYSI